MTRLTSDQVATAYADAEASLRLEGVDPAGDPFYDSLKARVVAGEVTPDQARQMTADHFAKIGRRSAAA